MVDCRARLWIDRVKAPVHLFRPVAEMTRESSIEQRTVLTASGASFLVVENGIHGSSMLLDSRTDHNMSAARATVVAWLKDVL